MDAEPTVFQKNKPLDETGLKAILASEMATALGNDGGRLSEQRRQALKQYEGEKYGNEVEGRSQVVDRTIMETVEWIMPALMRIFAAAPQIVQVEPQTQADEEQAKQQTAYLNYIFMRDNPGFVILYTWFKDALLQKLGWVKAYWDIERRTENEVYKGLTQEQYDGLLADPDREEVECKKYPLWGPTQGLVNAESISQGGEQPSPTDIAPPLEPVPLGGMPPPDAVIAYDCTFRKTINHGRVKVVPAAPEEVLISRRATRHNVPFVCHRRRITRSELIEMGYPSDVVMTLSPYDEQEYNQERVERFRKTEDDAGAQAPVQDPSMVEVWINEAYFKCDMEGDGIAKLRKVVFSGDQAFIILSNELADEMPLHWTTPIIMPHTLVGMSLADLVGDLQLIKTTIWRQTLDNLYLANNARHYVNEDNASENTYDDLLTSRPGSIVRGHGPQEMVVTPLVTPFVAAQSFPMLEYVDQQTEKRSGVSKGNQGVPPDALTKQTAIGSMGIGMLQEAAAQRVELIARIFAEDTRELFRAILGLVIRNQQSPRVIKISEQWTPIDPSSWKSQPELTVSVGLGTGNRDKMVSELMQQLGLQKEVVALQNGLNGPLVTATQVYKTWTMLVHAMGFKHQEDFVADPANAPPPEPPPPDPAVQVEQLKQQGAMATIDKKAQTDIMVEQMKQRAQAAQEEVTATMEARRHEQEMAQEMAATQYKIDAEMRRDLEVERMRGDIQLQIADRNNATKLKIAHLTAAQKAQAQDAAASSNAPN